MTVDSFNDCGDSLNNHDKKDCQIWSVVWPTIMNYKHDGQALLWL